MKDQHIGALLKYERLKSLIMESLQNGDFKPGDKLPSQNEMAEMYGISSGTVREAVASLVQDGLLYRIQGKGTFVSEAKDQQSTIALIMPHLHLPDEDNRGAGYNILAPIVSYIQDEAFRNNIDLLLYFDDDSVEKERQNIERVIERQIDGVIIYYIGEGENDEYIRMLKDCGMSLVMIDRYLDSVETDFVGTANLNGAKMAVELMVDRGFEHIYYISNSSCCSSTRDRMEGYKSAMKDASLEPIVLPRWVPKATNKGESDMAYLVAKEAIESTTTPFGFFCLNSLMAAGVARAISESGIDPKDVSLSYFDDEDFGVDQDTFLVEVLQPFESIARRSVHMLMEQMVQHRPPTRVFMAPTLRINKSILQSNDWLEGGRNSKLMSDMVSR